MFYNGSIQNNFNFKSICSLKQKEQPTRISYENNWDITISPDTTLEMEESRRSIGRALQRVGVHSKVCWYWEIYKLLFLLHNVKPDWIEVDISNDNENFNKVFIIYVSSNLNIVIN